MDDITALLTLGGGGLLGTILLAISQSWGGVEGYG